VSVELAEFKERILKLLEEDREFRYAVAGLIGLREVLERLDRHEEQLVKIWERLAKIDEEIAKIWGEIARLREDMNKGFERHDKELAALREDQRRIWEEIARLREDMVKGFERHDQQFVKVWSEIEKLREDMVRGFERHEEQIAKLWSEIEKLREDMNKGFERVERRISALGARWGIESEEAFREGLRGILEKELGFKVERWRAYDERGLVFGYPSEVEIDVAVVDEKVLLIEVSSHVRASDVYTFKRKAELYKEKTGREPARLVIVTPYADEKAFNAAVKLGVEIYTKV